MAWFQQLCRNLGRTIHEIGKPLREEKRKAGQRQVVSKQVEEKKVNESVTLRRTTIEEVEIRQDGETEDEKA